MTYFRHFDTGLRYGWSDIGSPISFGSALPVGTIERYFKQAFFEVNRSGGKAFEQLRITAGIEIVVFVLLKGFPFFNNVFEVFLAFRVIGAGYASVHLQTITGTLEQDTHQKCTGSTLGRFFGAGGCGSPREMIFGEVQVIDHLVVDEFTADTWLINIFIHIGRGRFERHVSPIAHKVESIQRSQKFCFRNQ